MKNSRYSVTKHLLALVVALAMVFEIMPVSAIAETLFSEPLRALIRETDICCKRPGTGIPPEDLEQVVGRKAARDCRADELVDRKDFV